MTLTIEKKADAVAVAHERLLAERPGWATLAEVLGEQEAKEKLARIDRGLERLAAEARRLATERRGDGAGPPEAASRAAMEAHTRKIEDGFHRDLARLGHADDHTPAVRRQIEAEALGYVRETHGEHACSPRLVLKPRQAFPHGLPRRVEATHPLDPSGRSRITWACGFAGPGDLAAPIHRRRSRSPTAARKAPPGSGGPRRG